MKFTQQDADLYVPDGTPLPRALERTTHLAVGAHPDDQELMAYHGIAACFGAPDRWFTGVCLTDGRGSSRAGPYARYTDAEMAAVRRLEQRKAAGIGDYACEIQLAYRSAHVHDPSNTGVLEDLVRILETAQPQVVYLHNPADKHDSHVAAFLRGLAALRALPAEARPAEVYGVELWRSLDWVNDDEKVALDVGARPNLRAALYGVFDSQITGGKRYDLAAAGRQTANATFFEPHAADVYQSVAWAVDLAPLLRDARLDPADWIGACARRFEDDVKNRLRQYDAPREGRVASRPPAAKRIRQE